MKILCVLESPSWCDHHLAGSLEDMGHEVVRFNYGDCVGEFYGRRRREERKKKNETLINLTRKLVHGRGLDLIFCYVYDDFLLPETAKILASFDVAMVNLNVDMVNQWYRQTRTAKYFTRILCAQKSNMEAMERFDAKVFYFPMAARIPPTPKRQVRPLSEQVLFVGTWMPYREQVLKRVHDAGLPIHIYGKRWLRHSETVPRRGFEKLIADFLNYGVARLSVEGPGGFAAAAINRFFPGRKISKPGRKSLPEDILLGIALESDLAELFRNSKVNIGITRMIGEDPDRSGSNQVKLRDFEVPMAGGFYLVEKAPDYEKLFVPGTEVETWANPGELIEKASYYLEHETERNQIAMAGMARARSHHIWQVRFQSLFSELGLTRG